MKVGEGLVVLMCAVVAWSVAPPLASGTAGKAAEVKFSSFKFMTTNGYEVEVIALREGKLTGIAIVDVDGGQLAANYQVRTDSGAGIHATFGSLGQVDVSFERRRRQVAEPEGGCRVIAERGVFRGSFHFTGEGGYFVSGVKNPTGEVLRFPNGFCGFGDRVTGLPDLGLDQTVLAAETSSAGGAVKFEASRLTQEPRVRFEASTSEKVEGMKIQRSAHAFGEERTFLSTGASRATVSPPPPFTGTARFRDPASGSTIWTGSLSVSFLGAPGTFLAGETFKARLCPRLPILATCLH
jgi:hypothetical protein